jgi:hypothetical protein
LRGARAHAVAHDHEGFFLGVKNSCYAHEKSSA